MPHLDHHQLDVRSDQKFWMENNQSTVKNQVIIWSSKIPIMQWNKIENPIMDNWMEKYFLNLNCAQPVNCIFQQKKIEAFKNFVNGKL